MLLSEAIQGTGKGLQREADLAKPIDAMRRQVQRFFLLQSQVTLEVFERLRSSFPLAEAEGVPPPPWEPLWEVVATETAGELEVISREYVPGAMTTGGTAAIADIGITATFDLANPRAVAYMEDAAAALVTRVNETTRSRLATIVTNGARAGTSYANIARNIVAEFEAMAIPKPQKHIRNRAELIAITELGNAYEESGAIVGRDLIRAGITVEKYWSNLGDNRVSEGCIANTAAGWIPEAMAFPSGHGAPLRFPGCRCGTIRRVV